MKKYLLALLSALVMVAVSGCGVVFSPEELYSLPKLPPEYAELDKCISAVLGGGAEYAAPLSGTNIQPVQMVDLGGDGQQEAVAFFRDSAAEKPLKIYVFSAGGETYAQSAVIEGSGTAIYSIAYNDLDGDGWQELIVGWRASTEVQALTVYSLRSGRPEEIMRSNYVKYAVTDLDQDGLQELVVIRADEEGVGLADYYGWQDGTLTLKSYARISCTMAELSGQQGRVQKGTLPDGVPALFVTGVQDSSQAITDILTCREGELTNVLLSDVTGVSTEVSPYQGLYPTDINDDAATEVPRTAELAVWGSGDTFRLVEWLAYDDSGASRRVLTTYHDMESGWYLRLPEDWLGRVQVTRSQGLDEAAATFSIRGEGQDPPREFLKISTFTGSSREVKAVRSGRVILGRQAESIFTAELLGANQDWAYGVTEDQVREAFSLIPTEWVAGDN